MSIASMPVMQAPDQLLQQALYGQVPDIQPYQALAELNKRVKTKQMSMAQMGNQAIQGAQAQQQQPPVAQQLMQANHQLDNGIAALNTPTTQAFNAGGIVAFAGGDMVPSAPTTGYDDIYLRARSYGIDLSPYDSPEDRASKIQRMKVMDEFMKNGRSLTEIPTAQTSNRVGTEKGRDTNLNNFSFTPPPPFSVPIPDVSIMEPPPVTSLGGGSGGVGGIARPRSAVPVGGITSSFKPGKAPEYNPKAAEYKGVPEVTPEEIQAQIDKGVAPKMAAYAAKMEKYNTYAQSMQRGETVPKVSRMQRGLGALLDGASDEITNARRAGVKPSLGVALGSAGSNAVKQDRLYQERLAAAKEKGMEAEMNMEKARLAYEAGQTDLAAKYYSEARRSQADAAAIANKNMEASRKDDADKFGFKFDDYKAREAARERAAENAANRANQLTIANIAAESREAVGSMRGAGGGGRGAIDKSQMSPYQLAQIRDKARDNLKDDLFMLVAQAKKQAEKQGTPFDADRYRAIVIEREVDRLLGVDSGTLPPAPSANLGVSPSKTIDFLSIK